MKGMDPFFRERKCGSSAVHKLLIPENLSKHNLCHIFILCRIYPDSLS
jgi:hypothetical protein